MLTTFLYNRDMFFGFDHDNDCNNDKRDARG